MKKIVESLRSVTQKGSDTINELVNEGIGYMTGMIGHLPFLASKEVIEDLSDKQFDEKHYFLIPFRVTDAGYTFYSMRVLPDGVPPVNSLPKRRIFHFSNEHGENLAQSLLIKEIHDYYEDQNLPTSDAIGSRLVDIANEIDKVDNKLTNGLLVIGGLVAFLNPLVGVGIAAKALIPGVGGALSKYGLRSVGEKLNEKALRDQIKQAEKDIINEFKDSNTLHIVNPILQELEIALDTNEAEHDPSSQFDFSNSGFSKDSTRLTKLTCTAITNTYKDIQKNTKLYKQASLGPEDIRWLHMIAEVANEKTDELSVRFRALRSRITIVRVRLQNGKNADLLDCFDKIEKHFNYLADNGRSTNNLFNADEFELNEIITEYLPQAIDNYLRLPPDLANQQILKNGKTAEKTFKEQIVLLEQTLSKLADSIYREEAREIILHGRFLKKIYARSFLDLDL